MKRITVYTKMRVLGAVEASAKPTIAQRIADASTLAFRDEDGDIHHFTKRTIATWWYRYKKDGVTAMKPRADKGRTRRVQPEDLLTAIEKALPHFKDNKGVNVKAVYRLCIEKGYLLKNHVSQTTFYRVVNKHELLKPEDKSTSKARLAFSKAHANEMWQGDTLHGPHLYLSGKKQQVFLIAFIDDASRVITHGEFFTADNTTSLIDCFQTALYKRGVPRSVYVDNGSNYKSKEFSTICARLGALLIHTPVRDGAAKGKIERFFRTVRDQFLSQNLAHITTLHDLNKLFRSWVEDVYHMREHSTLGMTPINRFGLDLDRIHYLTTSEFCAELFYLEKNASVRADNTFQYNKVRYEAPRDVRKKKVTIRYDRTNPLTPPIVYYEGERLGEATAIDFHSNDRKPLEPLF